MNHDHQRRPMLYIVCGLPFSGKTAVSRGLTEKWNDTVHVEIDQINTGRGLGIDGASILPAEWSETYQRAYEVADSALSAGQDVVFDAANYSRAQRDILRMHAGRQDADSAVIFVDVSEEECRARWQADRESGDRYDVRDEDFERVVDRFDPPTADERVVLFLPGMTVDDLAGGLSQM